MIPSRQKLFIRVLIEVDEDGEVVQVTPEAASVTGWKAGDLISGRILAELTEGNPWIVVDGSDGADIRLRAFAAGDGSGWLLAPTGETVETPRSQHVGTQAEFDLAYRAFFEQAPIGIVHLDAAGGVIFENHALRQIFGEGPDTAWLGRSIYSIEAIGHFLKPLIERMLADGRPFDAKESVCAGIQDVDQYWLRVSGMPIRNMDGLVAGGVMTVQDVTDLKRAEEVIERERSRAEADSRMKTELIATLSHELRTPVGTIRGYADMLDDELSEGQVDDRLREFAGAIRERACHLEGLVSDLVEFVHLETGRIRPQLQDTSLAELVKEVAEGVAAAYENPVEVVVVAEEPVICSADPNRLRSVLKRIVDNALKFTAEGQVTITTAASNDAALITIEDTGIGMDPAYVARIFDPFSQAEPVLNRQFEGAGLGLAVSRRVVEHMGGSITVDSSPGDGTVVTLVLPVATANGQDEG